jgi:hypothetical protein
MKRNKMKLRKDEGQQRMNDREGVEQRTKILSETKRTFYKSE